MAVVITEEKLKLFEELFAHPSIERMLTLSWQDFEQFIAHVFRCAGYMVEYIGDQHFPVGTGFDLNLYPNKTGKLTGKPLARVEVRRFSPENTMDLGAVMEFVGKLQVSGGIPGFIVTTSDFKPAARVAAAKPESRTTLINGKRLLRYITYVGGSRLDGEYAGARVAPTEPIDPTILLSGEALAAEIAAIKRTTRVLAIGNNKGGVAKTTSALNLAHALAAKQSKHVLLVDLDGQASLSRSLPAPLPPDAPRGAPPPRDQVTIADYFRGKVPISGVIRRTRFERLDLVPANSDLLRLDSGAAARAQAELQFIRDLYQLTIPNEEGVSRYDWIILDTPPAQSFYARIAMGAAGSVLIPACAEDYAELGVNQALLTTRTMHALTDETSTWTERVAGCLITRWKVGRIASNVLGDLRTGLAAQGVKLFPFAIPADEAVTRALHDEIGGRNRGLFNFAARPGPAAEAYERLAKEI